MVGKSGGVGRWVFHQTEDNYRQLRLAESNNGAYLSWLADIRECSINNHLFFLLRSGNF
jgi:hypothetical protein